MGSASLCFAFGVVALLYGPALGAQEAAQSDSASTRALTAQEVDAAIAEGFRTKRPIGLVLDLASMGFAGDLIRSSAERTGGRYAVILQGPYARVESAAADHAKQYLPYTRDSVDAALLAPFVAIRAMPQSPAFAADHRWHTTPDVVRVVLMPTDGVRAAIQPESQKPESESHTYGSGMTAETHGVTALFRIAEIPTGDFDVVLVTTGQEKRERVKKSWRDQLR